MLGAIPFLDGATYSFDDYYRRSFEQIAKAAGHHILFQRTGNPRFSDRLYMEMRTPELAKEDSRLRKQWEREFSTPEAEEHQRVSQSLEWLEKFDLRMQDLPCFVFITQEGRRVGLLRMTHRWYESESSWRIFLRCFCAWLEGKDVRKVATADLVDAAVSRRLSRLLRKLTKAVDDQLQLPKATARAGDAIRTRSQVAPFGTPEGATWGDVQMRFRDGHTVFVRVWSVSRVCNFTEMGMVDRRDGNPTKQWKLLEAFATERGILDWTSSQADPKNQKRRENLANNLRDFFRIEGDPFRLTDDGKGWQALFRISFAE
ncbi:MAG: hypothetical protein KAY32_16325 [Candidatus Eisenbacteria sp.]|nr:hypothetical protein [Candidatus Eisenbacteria bacterium]